LAFSSFAFEAFGEFSASALSDVIQVTAVSSRLFSQRLNEAGLQSDEFLSIFHGQHSLCVSSRFVQSCAACGEVEFNHFFNAGEGLG